jgi:DNA-binding NarL/FixJ family response regulator
MPISRSVAIVKAHDRCTIRAVGQCRRAKRVATAQAGVNALITKEAAVDDLYAAIPQTAAGDLPVNRTA